MCHRSPAASVLLCAAALIRISPEAEEQTAQLMVYWMWDHTGSERSIYLQGSTLYIINCACICGACVYISGVVPSTCVRLCLRRAVCVCSLLYSEHILTSASQRCIPVVIVSVKRKQSFKSLVLPVFAGAETLTFQLKFSLCVGVLLAQLFQENKQLGRYSGAVGKREWLPYAVSYRATRKRLKARGFNYLLSVFISNGLKRF